MLREAVSTLFDSFADTDLAWIRYRRGAGSVELRAMPGESRHDVQTSDGGIRTVKTRDFIVIAASLAISSVLIVPERGTDYVEQLTGAGGSVVTTFVVTHPAGAEPYRYCDAFKTLIRIQTVER